MERFPPQGPVKGLKLNILGASVVVNLYFGSGLLKPGLKLL